MIRHAEEGGEGIARARRRRAAMKTFMQAYDLTPAEWARQAGLSNANALYNFLNNRSSSLSQETLDRLVQVVPGATISQLTGEQSAPPLNVVVLPVRVSAAAGVWRPTYEAPRATEVQLAMPPKLQADEAVRITDRHVSQIYPDGAYCAIQSLASMARELQQGDKVLVHRIRDQKHEVTIREVRVDGEQAELVLLASDPKARAERLPLPWPYHGEIYPNGADRLQVRGRVVMMMIMDRDTMD